MACHGQRAAPPGGVTVSPERGPSQSPANLRSGGRPLASVRLPFVFVSDASQGDPDGSWGEFVRHLCPSTLDTGDHGQRGLGGRIETRVELG